MYDLRPAPKKRNPILLVSAIVGGIIAIPFAYALLLTIGAFVKGFMGW